MKRSLSGTSSHISYGKGILPRIQIGPDEISGTIHPEGRSDLGWRGKIHLDATIAVSITGDGIYCSVNANRILHHDRGIQGSNAADVTFQVQNDGFDPSRRK